MVTASNAAILLLMPGCLDSCCCEEGDSGLDTAAVTVETGQDSEPPETTETGEEPLGAHGAIYGNIAVTLFTTDDNGDVVIIPWDDSCFGDTFPYGSIFVTAYTVDEETGAEAYYGDDVIAEPSTDRTQNTYSIDVDADEVDEIYVYAALDKWSDRYISPSDPVGIYGDPITLEGDEVVNDVNIEILTWYWCGWGDYSGTGSGYGYGDCPDCPPWWGYGYGWYWNGSEWVYLGGGGGGGWHGGGGSGSCAEYVTVGGDLLVDVPYNGTGADVGTVLYYPGTAEPWWIKYDLAVVGGSEGAEGVWDYSRCPNAGTYDAQGVWDSNGNLLYDPADTWGEPVDDDGLGLGSITFGATSVLDQTMLIPVGGAGIDLVPFVRLSGQITMQEGSFDDILADHPDTRLYVAAYKYTPNGELDVADLEEAYDSDQWEAEDLAGAEYISYSLMAPAESIVYLWSALDLDDDGLVNEVNEPFAPYGGELGRYTTTEQSVTGLGMELPPIEEEGE